MFKVDKVRGFTLVELMVTVAIVGIIVAVAYPSYVNFVQSGYRGSAQADLMALAAALERHKAAKFSYKGAAAGGSDTGAPNIFAAHSPSGEPAAKKRYDLTISSVTSGGAAYVVKAKGVSGTPAANDGDLYLFSDGRKGWDKSKNGSLEASEYCWSC